MTKYPGDRQLWSQTTAPALSVGETMGEHDVAGISGKDDRALLAG